VHPEDVVDLQRYPIDAGRADPDRSALTARLCRELDSQQYCVLPGFLKDAARERAVIEAETLRPQAYHNCATRNCYLQRTGDASLPDDHPRNLLFEASTRMVAADLIGDDSPLKTLYHWQPFRDFIAEVVGAGRLYPNEDPMQPVNIVCYEPGDRSAWHFDSDNAFTMTLMLQAAEYGGDFELVPNTRTDSDPNTDYLGAVLRGERAEDVVQVGREPGALCLFRGCNSVHRVSPVAGRRLRIMSVFVYETVPGVTGDPEVNETVYGRSS